MSEWVAYICALRDEATRTPRVVMGELAVLWAGAAVVMEGWAFLFYVRQEERVWVVL